MFMYFATEIRQDEYHSIRLQTCSQKSRQPYGTFIQTGPDLTFHLEENKTNAMYGTA